MSEVLTQQPPITRDMLARLCANMAAAERVSARFYRAEHSEATNEECREAFVALLVKTMFRD